MASSQVEFVSSTSPFSCINTRNHHRVEQAKNLFDHLVRDHLNNNNNDDDDDNFCSWDTNNKAKDNLGILRFVSNERDQDESSTLAIPNHEEPSPSSSSSSSSSSPPTPFRKQKPPPISVPPSDFSSPCDVSNLKGASSLVQIWEKRLTQSSDNTTKSSSTPKSSPNATSSSSSSPQSSSSSEKADSPQGQIQNEVNHHHQRERSVLRVADIIKRLTATGEEIVDNNNQAQDQNYCVGSPEQSSENRSFVIYSPRIRGRQAFNDFLMQIERDRHSELNNLADGAAVSKFSHRGRIQSSLRLRLMQRGIVAKDQRGFPSTTSQSQVIKKPQGSVIMRLRERFSSGIKNGTASVEAEVVEPRIPCGEEDQLSSPIYDTPNAEEEQAPPSSHASVPSSEAQNEETTSSMADLNPESEVSENVEGREEKHNNNVSDQTIYDETEEEEEGSEEEYGERMYEIEEVENSEQIYGETNFDWISQISKPKSYWEDRKQAWYKEMLDNNESQNADICQLLQRRTVSNFLSSDFRGKMDRLMESHKGTQTNLLASRDDEEVNHHGKIGQLVAVLQKRLKNPAERDRDEGDFKEEAEAEAEEEEEDDDDDEEEEEGEKEDDEEEILISDSYNGESDFVNQSSPSQWRYGDNEGGDDSEFRSPSVSLTQPSQSPSFFADAHKKSSPTNPPSIEMELIYDLRGHMKQLYQEMSELRKSIRSCIDMQMILQKSLNQENNHTAKGKKFHDRILKKGNCCICSKVKADSLLYRCGHMCTCLKCANELRWKNGTCPICEAPIVDVVRVYVDA